MDLPKEKTTSATPDPIIPSGMIEHVKQHVKQHKVLILALLIFCSYILFALLPMLLQGEFN